MPHVLIKYAHVLICINRARVPGTLVHFILVVIWCDNVGDIQWRQETIWWSGSKESP